MKEFTRALLVLALDLLQGEHPPCPRCGMKGGTSVSYAAATQKAWCSPPDIQESYASLLNLTVTASSGCTQPAPQAGY